VSHPDQPKNFRGAVNQIRLLVVFAIILSLISGCAYVPTRSVDYDPVPVATTRPAAWVVAIRTLEEGRSERAYPNEFGRLFLAYVPFIPYVRIPYERLDESDLLHNEKRGTPIGEENHFTASLTRAIAADLSDSGLFKEVRQIGDGPVPEDVDFILEGFIGSTGFDVYATSYMLGMAGVLLWILPIPIGKQEARVDISLQLRDRTGKEVWADQLSGTGSRIYTLYNSGGAPVSSRFTLEIKRYADNDEGIDGDSLWAYHAAALRSGMKHIKSSLASFLGN
jgi:hypothetical protein